jgi:tRNA-2-methylthio-N6-dimethylallyladenosine synthase
MARFFLQTFGCQMNKNDSERIVGLLNSLGLQETAKVEKVDLIVVNTCSVRKSAEDRVWGSIRKWQKMRLQNPNLIIAVTGCMPGRDKDGKIKNKLKGIDLFFGIEELVMLPKWLRELNPDIVDKGLKPVHTGKIGETIVDYLQIDPKSTNNFQSFITIQTGCNNFCAYCIVPYSRGREKNRPIKEILKEIKKAIKQGSQEVCLLGQVVNNYKAPDRENFKKDNPFVVVPSSPENDDFAALLWEVDKIYGLKRLYYTAADPQYFTDAQVEALKLPSMLNYLHLPLQSGDDEVLKKMNRKYTTKQYYNLIKKIKRVKPDIALGTDVIVGFSGESSKQFKNTLKFYKECQFDIAYPAKYSQREGTSAAKAYKDDVSIKEKKRRWQAVQDLMEEIAFKKNQRYLNKIISVLVEDNKSGQCFGRSSEMKFVQFSGDKELIGKIVNVKVNWVGTWVLRGDLCL